MVVDMCYITKIIKRIVLFILTLLVIFLLFKLAIFYIPFLIGFIISLLIEPLIKFISKKTKITRKISAILVLLIIFTIFIAFISWGIITLITESSNFLQNINSYIEKIYNQIQNYINEIDLSKINIPEQIISLINTYANNFLELITKWISSLLTSFLQGITYIPIICIYIIITILSTYFICTDKLYIKDQLEHHFPKTWVKKIDKNFKKIILMLGCYLKAETILILISFIEILFGLYLLKWMGFNVTYPLLSALGIGFVDALPILRSRISYDTMGNNIKCKWKHKTRCCFIYTICNNNYSKTNIRAKNSK